MTSLHIAFDPLRDTPLSTAPGTSHNGAATLLTDTKETDSSVANPLAALSVANLSPELRQWLEVSLEALAEQDAATSDSDATEELSESFDLDEGTLDDEADGSNLRHTKPGLLRYFSFDLRNIVMASGVALGSMVLFWTYGLLSPTAPLEAAELNGAARSAKLQSATSLMPQNPDSEAGSTVAPHGFTTTVPSSFSASTLEVRPAMRNQPETSALQNVVLQAGSTNSPIITPQETTETLTLQRVPSQAALDNSSAPQTGQRMVTGQQNSGAAITQNPSLASRSDALFNPISSSSATAPIVITSEQIAAENKAQIISMSKFDTETTAGNDNTSNKPKQLRFPGRGRGSAGNRPPEPGNFANSQAFPGPERRRMNDRQKQNLFAAPQAGNLRGAQ